MNRTAQGILAILAACVIWGLSPLYYNLLTMVPPLELLAQRTLWSFLFFALVFNSIKCDEILSKYQLGYYKDNT